MVVFTVAPRIGVQQEQVNPTILSQPRARHYGAAGERYTNLERHAVSCERLSERYGLRINSTVARPLLAACIDALSEVAVAIQQADTNHG